MSRVLRPAHQRGDDHGFTLVELLVVMIVIGILAAIAIPTATMQRRKAYETSAKADIKVITKEVLSLYVDETEVYDISSTAGTWEIRSGATVMASGKLSRHNEVSAASYANDSTDFCISIRNTEVDAQFWTADDVGLRAGDC